MILRKAWALLSACAGLAAKKFGYTVDAKYIGMLVAEFCSESG